MKNSPNSRVNLDKAIVRFAGDPRRENELRNLLANAIVAHMIGDGVVKGGSGLRFRYGDRRTRATMDLDTAWRTDLDSFLKGLKQRLADGWNGFSGEVIVMKPAAPKGVPFDYVMQPCEVKLTYRDRPWFTVSLEIGHNEIGDADECENVKVPSILSELLEFLSLPMLRPIPMMRLEYQIAQKLHGATAPESRRAHDLVDIQLILANDEIDLKRTRDICQKLFRYRKVHAWPPTVVKNPEWEQVYAAQSRGLSVLPTVDEAVEWANDLVRRINNA